MKCEFALTTSRFVPSGRAIPGTVGRRAPISCKAATVAAPVASLRRRTTSAIAAPSSATRLPPRIVAPISTAAFETGVAAVTPGIALSVRSSAQAGTSPVALGSIRTSAPAVQAA